MTSIYPRTRTAGRRETTLKEGDVELETRTFLDRETALRAMVVDLSDILRRAISGRGKATLAVSGGRTPELLFPALSQSDLDWSRVTVTLIDERWVAPDHPDSNEGLARRLLLQGPAAAARMVGLKVDGEDPVAARRAVEDRLAGLDWPLDAAFLGMGEDGHVASLFPGDLIWPAAPGRSVGIPATEGRQARMSLTPGALLEARHLLLVAFGAEKRKVLERAMEPGTTLDLPIRLVLDQDEAPLTVYAAD